MASQLHLDPVGGELLSNSTAWKELDAKFLSNDTATTAQKTFQPVTPSNRLDHILNHPSLYIRASDLILFVENVGYFHLKQHFQAIVEAIFGTSGKYSGWALRGIAKNTNPREAAVICKLLGATGSLVNLATRMLEDPSFVIDMGLDKLPFVLTQRMFQGDIPAFFSSRLVMSDLFPQQAMTAPVIKCLRVNSFEFFFLSFTSHICALRGVGSQCDYLDGWGTMTDNLYNNLLEDYLSHFFPCNGLGVPCENFQLSYQQVNDSMYVAQNLRSHMTHMSNLEMSNNSMELSPAPRLLKASLLMEQVHPSPRSSDAHRKTQSQKEVWRTETILLICSEMWMAHAPGASYKNASPVSTDQFGKVMLPTVDVVKSVRMLVRHSHFFLNCLNSNPRHPMIELKRDGYLTYQKRLYRFLRHLFYNWPLDNSFRIVYETWLSYVQPWRYVNFEKQRSSPGGKEATEELVDSRWYGFIQDNVLFYTKLFNIMLQRMSRMDFATTKNAQMFYRVAKVFTGPEHLKLMLMDIDNNIMSYEQPYYMGQINGTPRSPSSPPYGSPFNRFSIPGEVQKSSAMFKIASLKQQMKDYEQPDFSYEPMFSETNKKIMYALTDLAKSARLQLQEVIDATLLQQKRDQTWWDKLMGPNKYYNAVVGQSISELNKAISQLETGVSQFASFFEIPLVEPADSRRNPVYTPTRLPRTTFIGSTFESSTLEGTENRITVLPSGTFNCDMLVPIGNPDFSPARSDESNIAVFLTNQMSGRLNDKFAGDIMRHYFQRSWKGRLARAAFAEPVEYFDIERKGRSREKLRKVLPPRVSLRFMASVNFLVLFMIFFAVCSLCGVSYGLLPLIVAFWGLYVVIRAATEPEKKLDDLIYIYGDRNYNVDFRGLRERPLLDTPER